MGVEAKRKLRFSTVVEKNLEEETDESN